MSATSQMNLAQTRRGRMVLHLLALTKDRHVRWHLLGIVRELRLRCDWTTLFGSVRLILES